MRTTPTVILRHLASGVWSFASIQPTHIIAWRGVWKRPSPKKGTHQGGGPPATSPCPAGPPARPSCTQSAAHTSTPTHPPREMSMGSWAGPSKLACELGEGSQKTGAPMPRLYALSEGERERERDTVIERDVYIYICIEREVEKGKDNNNEKETDQYNDNDQDEHNEKYTDVHNERRERER